MAPIAILRIVDITSNTFISMLFVHLAFSVATTRHTTEVLIILGIDVAGTAVVL